MGESYPRRILSSKGLSDNAEDQKHVIFGIEKLKIQKKYKIDHDNQSIDLKGNSMDEWSILVFLNLRTKWCDSLGDGVWENNQDHMVLHDELQRQEDFHTLLSEKEEVEIL